MDTRPQSKHIEIEKLTTLILRGSEEYEGKTLPICQGTGTGMQIRSHAKQLATQFYQNYIDNRNQYDLQQEIVKIDINVVTCGSCGGTVLHRLQVTNITCPYCEFSSEPCDFPDLNY